MSDTPRCDTLAQEHQRLMAVPGSPGVVQDWIALARTLERELAEARTAFEDERRTREAIQADFERGVAYAGQLRETLDRFISDSVSREDMERGIADEEDRRLRAENRASELLDEVDDLRAYAGQMREALKEISKMRGCTVRSFEEVRDGWKDACVIAFGQAADIADAALAKNPNPAGAQVGPDVSGAGRAGTTSVHSQFTDSERLDWLEAEMDREHNTSGYRSLFRRNVPITREAIDEMMRERLPGDAPEISAAEEWSRDLQAAAGKTVHPIWNVPEGCRGAEKGCQYPTCGCFAPEPGGKP